MTLFSLPFGTAVALAVVVALPFLAYGLYCVDARRANGHVTIFGRRRSES